MGVDYGWGQSESFPWFNEDMALPFAQFDYTYEEGSGVGQPPGTPDLHVMVASQGQRKYMRLFPIPFDAASGISADGETDLYWPNRRAAEQYHAIAVTARAVNRRAPERRHRLAAC